MPKRPAPQQKSTKKNARKTLSTKPSKSKKGCAYSFLTEERGELDEECERTPEELKEEYHQPDKEKEAGGEGGS